MNIAFITNQTIQILTIFFFPEKLFIIEKLSIKTRIHENIFEIARFDPESVRMPSLLLSLTARVHLKFLRPNYSRASLIRTSAYSVIVVRCLLRSVGLISKPVLDIALAEYMFW